MSNAVIDAAGFHELVSMLIDRGYSVVGPTLSGSPIVLAELTSADDLPLGWGVDVGPGHYRLRRRDDDALFGHSAGPHSWKQFLHPPRQRLWTSGRGRQPWPRRVRRDAAWFGQRGGDSVAARTGDRRTPAVARRGSQAVVPAPSGSGGNRITQPGASW